MQTINYAKFIKSARAAARDILRLEKVSDLLGFIRNAEAKLKNLTTKREELVKAHAEVLAEETKALAKQEHKLRVAEATEDPDAAAILEKTIKMRAAFETFKVNHAKNEARVLANYDENATEAAKPINEKIAEYKEKIANWESGKTKVSYEEMVALATCMTTERVRNSFTAGNYDDYEDAPEATDEATS